MRLWKWALILVAMYVCASLIGGAILVDRALKRPRLAISAADRAKANDLARALGATIRTVSISAQDGALLRAWQFTPATSPADTVVLLHGIVSNRASMLGAARLFLERGYRVLAVDARASGESGGERVTYGALEGEDLRRWIAMAADPPGSCVYTFGLSMGASFALEASDASGLCAVVAVSGEASLREIAFDRIGERIHLGPRIGRTLFRPALELGFLSARLRYGINLSAASTLDAVARPGVAILVMHGTDDDITAVRHARVIHDANPARVSLWLVPGGTHAPAAQAGTGYPSRIFDFLEAHRQPWR